MEYTPWTQGCRSGESVMKLMVPPFSFDQVPQPREMAESLVCALPEAERSAATNLLLVRILPIKLAGLGSHPRPQRLTAVVYKDLARVLSAQPPNMRLHALKLYAIGTEIVRLGRDALHVAIARFLLGNTGTLDAEKLERWLSDAVQDLRMLSADELAERAREIRAEAEAWRQQVTSEYPAEWEKQKSKYMQVCATLDAAEAASFDRAAGQFYEFLRDADREPEELVFE